MKLIQTFPGFAKPTQAEVRSAWDTATVSLDANVLLNFYRYSLKSRQALFDILKSFGSRVWITHQAAIEFHRNRTRVIESQLKQYTEARDLVTKLGSVLRDEFRHPFVDASLHAEVETSLTKLRDALELGEKEQERCLHEDQLLTEIAQLFQDRIGDAPQSDASQQKIKTAQERLDNRQPPGFCDAKKDGDRALNDCILWLELLDHSSEAKSDLIFVTDDQKDDWWNLVRGKRLGPRPELSAEYRNRTGRTLFMYSPDRFIEQASVLLNASADTHVVEEARRLSARRAKKQKHKTFNEPLGQLIDLAAHSYSHREDIERFVSALDEAPKDLWFHSPPLHAFPDEFVQKVTRVLKECPCISGICTTLYYMPNPTVNQLWADVEEHASFKSAALLHRLWIALLERNGLPSLFEPRKNEGDDAAQVNST